MMHERIAQRVYVAEVYRTQSQMALLTWQAEKWTRVLPLAEDPGFMYNGSMPLLYAR